MGEPFAGAPIALNQGWGLVMYNKLRKLKTA